MNPHPAMNDNAKTFCWLAALAAVGAFVYAILNYFANMAGL